MNPLRAESAVLSLGGVPMLLQRAFWEKRMQIQAAWHRNTPEIVQGVQGFGVFPKNPIWDESGDPFHRG